ncbi:MAG: hypothetical protein AAF243_10535 [Cyanobacteria bacterium P01_A01_bin.137]
MRLRACLLGGFGLVGAMVPMAVARVDGVQAIEQPFEVRLGVTFLGLGLIGLELWWFLWKRR